MVICYAIQCYTISYYIVVTLSDLILSYLILSYLTSSFVSNLLCYSVSFSSYSVFSFLLALVQAIQCIISFEEEPFREYALANPSVDNTEATSRTAKTTVSTVVSDIHFPEIDDSRVNVIVTNMLRERFFGELDGKDLIYYNKVWPIDAVRAVGQRN